MARFSGGAGESSHEVLFLVHKGTGATRTLVTMQTTSWRAVTGHIWWQLSEFTVQQGNELRF